MSSLPIWCMIFFGKEATLNCGQKTLMLLNFMKIVSRPIWNVI